MSPASCVRCSRSAPLVTPSGLCVTCAATEETAAPSLRAEPPSQPEPATASFLLPIDPSTAPAPDAADRPLPPAPHGYDLFTRLGGGGMGEVYLAREHLSERPVAMKFLRNPGDPAALERFVVELRVLAKLDHPNIVRVYASDFLRADPYFTMEFVPGGSLAKAPGDTRSVADAVGLVRTIAAAVAVAHGASVIHRDLKPSNILLGTDGAPKIADFGLAKRLDESDPLTVASGALGTPGYMPPEQVSRKNGEIGAWSDVYGLGATLYHLLVGRAPFVGDSIADTITKVLVEPPERLRRRRPDVPLALEGIVMKCLEKDPRDRYRTVAELLTDLDRYEAGLRPVAPPLTRWRRATRWAKRNRRGLAGVGAALLLAGVALWVGLAFAPAPKPPAPPVVPEAPDPWAEIETELKARRPVRLVERTKPPRPPRWKEWLHGGTELLPSRTWNDAVAFETSWVGALALARDPMTDRYRVETELSHDRRAQEAARDPQAPGGANDPPTGIAFVGLLAAHERYVGANGEVVHWVLGVEYSDFWSEAELMLPDIRGKHAVAVCEYLFIIRGDGQPLFTHHLPRKVLRFAPANRPGVVRGLAVAATPAGVTFFWKDETKKDEKKGEKGWVEIGALTAAELSAREEFRKTLNARAPQAGIRLSDWGPRRPLGVYASSATVSLLSFTITPENP